MGWLFATVGIGMLALGVWGRRAAPDLVPPHLEVSLQEKRLQVMRRGAIVLQLAGALFVVCAVLAVAHPVTGP
jgi:hypothetical protein